MFKIACTLLVINFSFLAIAPGLYGTCKLCEDIRERNRQNPSSGYTYYEDYIKAEGNQKGQDANNQDANNKDAAPKTEVKAVTPTPQAPK